MNKIEGKPLIVNASREIHPLRHYLIAELAERFPGFTVTSNPFATSMGNDDTQVWLFGPFDDMGEALRVHEGPNGLYVVGLDLKVALMRLLHVGPPVRSRSPMEMDRWVQARIEECPDFHVPEAPPKTRTEMDAHIDACEVCQPVAEAMALAINAGSSAYGDGDVASMIEFAHHDQAAAIAYYQQKAAVHAGSTSSKPARKNAAEVTT